MAPCSPEHGAQVFPSTRIRQKRPQPTCQPSAPCRKCRWSRHPSQGGQPRAPCPHPVPLSGLRIPRLPTAPQSPRSVPAPLVSPHPACPKPGPTPWWPEQAVTYKGSTGGWPCRSSGRASLLQPSGPNSGSLWKVLRTPRGRPTPSAGKSVRRWDKNVAGAAAPGAPQVRQVRGQPLPGADAQRPPPPGSDAGPTCSRGTGTKTHTSAFRTDEEAVLLCGVNSHLKTVARAHEANPARPRDPRSSRARCPENWAGRHPGAA